MTKQLSYEIPLVFEPQREGGYTVTYSVLPELITEGDTIAEALVNVELEDRRDASYWEIVTPLFEEAERIASSV